MKKSPQQPYSHAAPPSNPPSIPPYQGGGIALQLPDLGLPNTIGTRQEAILETRPPRKILIQLGQGLDFNPSVASAPGLAGIRGNR